MQTLRWGETESYLLPQDVAGEAVAYIVGQRGGVAVSEVTLRPQYHRIRRKPVAKKGGDRSNERSYKGNRQR